MDTGTMKNNLSLAEIIAIEPRIGAVLEKLRPVRKVYLRHYQYSEAKKHLSGLAGWGAAAPRLRNCEAYDVVTAALVKKLKL